MSLKSFLFAGNSELEQCAKVDAAHILLGARGPHVGKIQAALVSLDGACIAASEWNETHYGVSTESAVLDYKKKRKIINRSYQTSADAIVGKMTMASLDADMLAAERGRTTLLKATRCSRGRCSHSGGLVADAVSRLRSKARAGAPSAHFAATGSTIAGNAQAPEVKLMLAERGDEGGHSFFHGVQYQMVPLGGTTRTVFAVTQGQNARLRVPPMVSVTVNGVPAKTQNEIVTLPGSRTPHVLTLKGLTEGHRIMRLRKPGEAFEDEPARDIMIVVKKAKTVALAMMFLQDAKQRRSEYTVDDAIRVIGYVKSFFKRWCNIDLQVTPPIEKVIDEDLGDAFDYVARTVAEGGSDQQLSLAGAKQRAFANDFDKYRGPTNKIMYFVWKLSEADTLAAHLYNRLFMQNYGKDDKKLALAMTHEIIHSLGVHYHTDSFPNIMYPGYDNLALAMAFTDIEQCNRTQVP